MYVRIEEIAGKGIGFMNQNESRWDKLLNIKTSGRDDSRADQFNYPYEPTPYQVLERLANSGYITKKSTLLDYGCGKGRVEFFLSYQCRCKTIGVEYDGRMLEAALENQKKAVSKDKTSFVFDMAQKYQVPQEVDCFFFFNPFSVEVLQKVMGRILESYYDDARNMQLFFYYPSDEYISYLMTVPELVFTDEISCQDLFEGNNKRERIVIFEVV